ncbi:MAG: hypothetical protein A3C85_01340 [Candidatus Doudnabacteria bacterium RIFCSPHIGHO2_02_FULL_48_21]|uniref:Uncharacterized protein n=1 Tax=Candidatus Doudnabacteria bacterium RIFCSPLOWO2_02_FULL_48_13 TaxID=1817845 RepID=A0A1F5Q9A6_9BACT|nr:MAG: hypothetical protein A3K05_04385 [Candidatus Doudnabacteria bacterium RIFCSPHIGHO2_01_48_18]OGE79601.1 MAG: hypothetical protein A2668_03395 [Candidatus Doudnabacteria bacterium RIFCSPHIGHO2_01_FULL_48_180]OGE91128.1 MAG: hypothetical protein A3F44_02280 [Candidatus Doudnabacteria bacterium RIFCSPHIGHO2_12_FULL_47_25]OGE93818.1 MAG: hypothetical protein A3C85_01340 [Candidatus Doudnabacteria bacterium RIFCSPHIGHO2_02_FULL_48_21]OGE98004.1 MAG: hypothetical protein A3A83_00925 [Candidatu
MDTGAGAIAKLSEEFSRHVTNGKLGQFFPSMQASTAVSMLTRDLEMKRELGHLSDAEKAILSQIDDLWEDIAKYNQSADKNTPPPAEQVYNLAESKMQDVPEEAAPPAHQPISYEQADQIIEGLNKQFEEKIMSKQRHDLEAGRNLQEYMAAVQNKKLRIPFAGEESQIDLSKLKSA